MKTADDILAEAFGQARTACAEGVGLWAETLQPDQLERLNGWLAAGLRLAVLVEDMQFTVMLIDSSGGAKRLQSVEFKNATKQ